MPKGMGYNGPPSSKKRSTSTMGKGLPKSTRGPKSGMKMRADGIKSVPSSAGGGKGYASNKGGSFRVAQGGEKEQEGITAGRKRTNKGKNNTTAGFQGFRG